ncbi:putative amino acid permease [Tersicoccus solisilvae]|uniref:Amino acid permease n=1 Tax=Tersicoccus solisilvae TaxID=1882339 RepID=A0ABQ1NLH7_9MICC|nr:APC family permease [Tersicoccus solisilvae]GGC80138.1 putative amino acid permease [Tersicoccus solisilvae]
MSAAPTTTGSGAVTGPKGLARGKLGLAGSTALGIASTSPVYSLAATLGLVIAACGPRTPVVMVLAFVPMLFIAVAYRELNAVDPDCGTTFTWVSRAFGRRTGWMGGWAMALAGIIVLANLALVAGQYLWLLIAPDAAENTWLVTGTGVVFIAVMTWVNRRGIDVGQRLQWAMTILQYAGLAIFAVVAVGALATGAVPGAVTPRADWFNPLAADPRGLGYGVLLSLFIYWGWDTCLALNEETRDPRTIPGRAAVLSSVILLITYVLLAVLVTALTGAGSDGDVADVLHDVSVQVMGPWAPVMLVAVLVSVVASTQTTILPTARGTLSMAVQGALPDAFARVHPRFLTPTFSTTVVGGAAIAWFVVMTAVSTDLLADSIAAISLFIAVYYALTGLACAWLFRRDAVGVRQVLARIVLPLAGAVAMIVALIATAVGLADPASGFTSVFGVGGGLVIGVVALLAGLPLMAAWYAHRRAGQRAD